MEVIATIIYPVAGYFYSIFGALGKLAMLPISEVIGGYFIMQSNPFTDYIVMLRFDGNAVLGEFLTWLSEFIPVLDMSVLGLMLLIIPATFIVSLAVRSLVLFVRS